MADFSLQDLWWLKPAHQDNPLPAMQLGAHIVQQKAQMDLQERELGNQIARTSLMRDEMLAKQKIQTMLAAGNAEMASAIADVNDWTDEEQVSRVWATGARNPMTVGGKAWLGAQHMVESARTAKRLEEESQSRIAARVDRTDFNNKKLALQQLLADHTIPLTDARVVKAQQEANLAERELLVKEANVGLRGQEVALKERRFDTAKWSPEDRIELKERTKVVHDDSTLTSAEKDQAIQEIRGEIEGNRLQREKFKEAKTVRPGLKADLDSEIKMANEAIAANPDRKAAIAEQFKKRTGRDLP